MKNVTIKSFSEEIKIPINKLIQKFADAGITKTNIDYVSLEEKKILLSYINSHHVNLPKNLSLQKKTKSKLNISSLNGKNKIVKIEVRKKKYLKCDSSLLFKDKIVKNNIDKTFCKKNIKDLNKTKKYVELSKNINEREINFEKKLIKEPILDKSKLKISKNLIKKNVKINKNLNIYKKNEFKQNLKKNKLNKKEKNKKIEINYKVKNKNENIFKKIKSNRLFGSETNFFNNNIDKKTNIRKKISSLTHTFNKPLKKIIKEITIGETISVFELSNKMAVKSHKVVSNMMKLGIKSSINEVIDQDIAQIIAEEMGHKVKLIKNNALEEEIIKNQNKNLYELKNRAPVVTIMGHVDHGKTSLLDYIRTTKVALKEKGGITQCIGAYYVKTKKGIITFIDTPGHAAFTEMRIRGSKITDIIVIVIAADDSIMPQTVEAINHAKIAKVPVIIAINKIDKITSNPEKVKKELIKHGIFLEEYGGDTQCLLISAKSGLGIDFLLDAILLQAEILELKAMHKGMASGTVIESRLEKGKGPVSTILIQEGRLHQGDVVLCGCEYGKIKAMQDSFKCKIKSVGPSIPVEILGLSGIPISGDKITVVKEEKKAREVAIYRQNKLRESKLRINKKIKIENVFSNLNLSTKKNINIVLKSDAHGSSQAISNALILLSNEEIKINIIYSGVGPITETDVALATSSNAIIIGFNVKPDFSNIKNTESIGLNIKCCSIIYEIVDFVKQKIYLSCNTKYNKKIIGILIVKNIFQLPKLGSIAGCIVKEGIVKKNSIAKILRNKSFVHESKIISLRRFKEDVNEVKSGTECGIVIKNFNDIKPLDIIEILELEELNKKI
ncbi:infB [Wigglesworthia glossinidia endosymbiont of Glossina brevipalpis]|uniref:Translation initiation factor IF-2 n=1 Tax=Wigglesworthia glossinidia brevipalpis TaxID=36870 RepID=IF2_WIGBR|nr:RecName: Full=Translation initiation factor IF-2 [Wigglesworthia glossinidia endosymbiont of Glossina brevipalpis]BAC24372.1 infB [Wigglesworthia glossinidia endosymbiont of Glossina brevipalpis]